MKTTPHDGSELRNSGTQITRRNFLGDMAALAGASALLPTPFLLSSEASAASNEITVGFVTSMSGPISSLGIPYDQGMKAALSYRPEIAGKRIRFIALDDASDPTSATRNARKLVEEERVDILIGTAGTPGALAIATVAGETGTPLISTANINPDGVPGEWTVTVTQTAQLMIEGVVDHMKDAGAKTVGYIGFADTWGDQVYNALTDLASKAGLTVTSNERYARADTSVTGQALKVYATRPDVVIVGGSGTPGALPYIALRERGYRGQFYGNPAIINPDFVRVGGQAVEGLIATTGPVVVYKQLPDSNPTKLVSDQFAAALGKVAPGAVPNAFSGYAFDAWLLLADAAGRVPQNVVPGTPEYRKALRDALVTTKDLVVSHGIFNFNPSSRFGLDQRGRVTVKLSNGQWKLVA